MVEPSAAARHALAPAAIEPARAASRFTGGMARSSGSARRRTTRHTAKPLRGKAYNSGGLACATLAPNAEPDTWEEY